MILVLESNLRLRVRLASELDSEVDSGQPEENAVGVGRADGDARAAAAGDSQSAAAVHAPAPQAVRTSSESRRSLGGFPSCEADVRKSRILRQRRDKQPMLNWSPSHGPSPASGASLVSESGSLSPNISKVGCIYMSNKQNIDVEVFCILVFGGAIVAYYFAYSAYLIAYICNNMQKNMQKNTATVQRVYSAYFANYNMQYI